MGSMLTLGVIITRIELNFWMPIWFMEKLLVLENKSQNWCQGWDLLKQSGLMETCGLGREKKSKEGGTSDSWPHGHPCYGKAAVL